MPATQILTSASNPLLKQVRRAIARGAPTEEGFCVAEGFHLLEEAIRSNCEIKTVLAAESARAAVEEHAGARPGIRVTVLPDKLFQSAADTETSQGVMALVRVPSWGLEQLFRESSLVVVLDGVQDPGNAGTIVRTAEAFGASGVLFVKGSVNPWNPKALRASAGSLFRVPCVYGIEALAACAALRRNALEIYAGAPARNAATELTHADLTRPVALVIGSEGRGVSEALRGAARELAIPTAGVESLNAAVAAAILLYEARRQRSLEA